MEALYTVLRFTQVLKGRRHVGPRTRQVWLETARFADGPGMKVKSITFTTDREKAARYSLTTAHDIGCQFYTHVITLERPNGAPMEEATAALHAEQHCRRMERQKTVAEINRSMNELFEPILPLLRKAIEGK